MKNIFYLSAVVSILFIVSCKGKLPAVVPIKEATIDSSFNQNFRQTSGVIAGIGARSISLNNGKILWLYGKSHINDFNFPTSKMACNPNCNNAFVLQNNANFQTLNNGTNDIIPSNETNTYFTPLHGYQYFDTVFVFTKKEGGLTNNRTYIAKFQFPTLQFLRIDSMSLSNTIYGYSVIVDSSLGFCFVYGIKNKDDNNNANQVCVARIPFNNIHSTWLYFSNDQWLNHAQNAESIVTVPAENFSIAKVKQQYVLVTEDIAHTCNTGANIYTQVSSFVYGSFLNKQKIFTRKDKLNEVLSISSMPTIHTMFTTNTDLVVTYSVNGFGTCLTTCNNNEDEPDYYRVKTIRIPLHSINPSW